MYGLINIITTRVLEIFSNINIIVGISLIENANSKTVIIKEVSSNHIPNMVK